MNIADSIIPLLVGLYLLFFAKSLHRPGQPSFINEKVLRIMGGVLVVAAIILFISGNISKW